MTMGLQLDNQVVPAAPRRHRGWSPARLALLFLAAVLGVSVLRVVTGESDIASSGAIAAAIGLAVPIGLAGLGGLWSERAGVVNIGLEGMMILGCWGAALFGLQWGWVAGLVGGMLLGLIGGVVHAIATVYFGVDHVVSGVALNLIGPGAAKYLAARAWPNFSGVQSPQTPHVPDVTVPVLSDALRSLEGRHIFFVSDLAGVLGGLVTGVSLLTILAVLLVVATWWILWRTAFGLRLRSCGESPAAAETLGVNVYLYKYVAVLVSGALAGLGGAYLSLVAANMFRDGQSGGRGFIGLAALIFGNWRPGSLAAGSLMFGYFDAIQLRGNAIHGVLLAVAVALVALGAMAAVRRGRRALSSAGLTPGTPVTTGGLSASGAVVPAVAAAASIALGWYAAADSTPTSVRLAVGLAGVALLVAGVVLGALDRRVKGGAPATARDTGGGPRVGRLAGAAAMVGFGLVVLWWYAASESVPGQLTGAAPYVATLLVLALASQNLRAPAADGVIYRKGEGN